MGSDFLSDAGFLNLEATGKVQSTEIVVMAGHAPKKLTNGLKDALEASAAMFKPTEEHVDATH